jgi:hypothetical protein
MLGTCPRTREYTGTMASTIGPRPRTDSTHTLRRAVDFSRGTLLFLVQLYGKFFFGKRLFT